MKRILTALLRWAIVVTYAGIIFYVSSLAQPLQMTGIPISLPPGMDKVIHFCEFAVLCFLLCRAVDATLGGTRTPVSAAGYNALVICFLCTTLYGVSDEVHQLFVPPRSCDGLDVAADAAGAAFVAVLWPIATAWFPFLRR